MIQAVNMAGSSIYTLLAIIAIVTQITFIRSCPLAQSKPSSHHAPHRTRNSNTNINTNINTFRKSRRLYEAMARADAEPQEEKAQDGKDVQTAVIATAAAEAAKTVTRAITRRLSDTTADAVASAVIRVLTEEDDKKAEKKEQEEAAKEVAKAARRTSRFLNEALARLMYRSDPNPLPDTNDAAADEIPPEIVEKMLANLPPDQETANDKTRWGDGDGAQYSANGPDGDQDDKTKKKGVNGEGKQIHRRFLDYPESRKSHYRRAATIMRSIRH